MYYLNITQHMVSSAHFYKKKRRFPVYFRFFSKAKKAAMTPLAPAPAPPTVPRLVEDVVPDDRDDPEIILSTTTVSYK